MEKDYKGVPFPSFWPQEFISIRETSQRGKIESRKFDYERRVWTYKLIGIEGEFDEGKFRK